MKSPMTYNGGVLEAYSLLAPRGADRRALGVEHEDLHHYASANASLRPCGTAAVSSPDSPGLDEESMVILCQLHRRNPGLDAAKCQNILFGRLGDVVKLTAIRTFMACLGGGSSNNEDGGVISSSPKAPESPLCYSSTGFHKLVPSIDPRRLKFCGEMGIHWLEIFKRVGALSSSSPRDRDDDQQQPQHLYYSLVAFMGVRNPGSPLSPPVLFDLSDQTLDSSWFQRSLVAAVASRFFEKGDVLVVDPKSVAGWNTDACGDVARTLPSNPLPQLDDYLWNLTDPRDGQPLRLCLLWHPFANATARSFPTDDATTTHPNQYTNPVKLLFGDLLGHLHKYPLARVQRPVSNPHLTALIAKEYLSSVTVDQVQKWYEQSGYRMRGEHGRAEAVRAELELRDYAVQGETVPSGYWRRGKAYKFI